MTLFALGWVLADEARAQLVPPRPDLTLEAVAEGDFDCSGALDTVVLRSNADGDLVAEVLLGVTSGRGPISPLEGPTVEFADTDGDSCDELLVTAGVDEVYEVRGLEQARLLEEATGGEGDYTPDLQIQLLKPTSNIYDLDFGLGLGGFNDWGDLGECTNACRAWVIEFYPCLFDGDLYQICWRRRCTQWQLSCVEPGF